MAAKSTRAMRKTPSVALAILLCPAISLCQSAPVSAVEFADSPGKIYISAHEIAAVCNLTLASENGVLQLNQRSAPDERDLFDGTKLIALKDLTAVGATLNWDESTKTATVTLNGKNLTVKLGEPRVEVNKSKQELRAYQGDVLVLDTHVSTGRKGHRTPSGSFAAHGKERIHYSSLYDDAPMPWAVQIDGNVFIHGFTSVPRFPASHGCIRVPLRGKNPARWFWHWVPIGTPVTVGDTWLNEQTPLVR